MKFGIASSAEVEYWIERGRKLRNEYFAQQLRLGGAALSRLVHGSGHAAASGSAGASANPQRDPSVIMRTAHVNGNNG